MGEAIGVLASVIAIAEASLKLYDYIDSVRSADKRLTRVALNLKTTCDVVKEVCEVFQKKENKDLVSKNAIQVSQCLLECRR